MLPFKLPKTRWNSDTGSYEFVSDGDAEKCATDWAALLKPFKAPKFTFEPYIPKKYLSLPEPVDYKPFHVKEAERRERDTYEAVNALWGRHNRATSIRSIIEKGDEAPSTDLERACTIDPLANHMPPNPFGIPGREPLPMGPF